MYKQIRGMVFDSINTIGALMKPFSAEPTSEADIWKQITNWEKEAWDMMSRLKSYPTSCSVLDAYWRTLIADKVSSGGKPESNFYEAYKAACRTPPVTRLLPGLSQNLFHAQKVFCDPYAFSTTDSLRLTPANAMYIRRGDHMC